MKRRKPHGAEAERPPAVLSKERFVLGLLVVVAMIVWFAIAFTTVSRNAVVP